MPPQRVKGPPYLATVLIAVAIVAIIEFQSLRERRTSKAFLEEKNSETNSLHRELEALSETSEEMLQAISKLSIEKDRLSLERNSLRKQLIDLEHEKSFAEDEKNKLDLSLRGKTDEIGVLKLKFNELQQKDAELNLLKNQVKNLQKNIKFLRSNHKAKLSDHVMLASRLDAEQDKMEKGTENGLSSNMTRSIDSTTTTFVEKEDKNDLYVSNSAEATKAGQELKLMDQKNIKNEEVEEGGQEKGDDIRDHTDPKTLDKDTGISDEEQVADKEEDENEEKEEDSAESDEDEEEITDQQDDITEDIKQNIDHGDDNDHDEERIDIE